MFGLAFSQPTPRACAKTRAWEARANDSAEVESDWLEGGIGGFMSITSLTTLEVTRQERRPKKSDIGKAVGDVGANAERADEQPSLTETLATTVPTGLVAAYTAYIATIVANIDEPTADKPTPDQFLPWRWGGFIVLVLAAALITVGNYRTKRTGTMPAIPWLSAAAATVAAVGWGLGLPESPLIAAAEGDSVWLLPLAVAGLAVAINLILSSFLKKQAGSG